MAHVVRLVVSDVGFHGRRMDSQDCFNISPAFIFDFKNTEANRSCFDECTVQNYINNEGFFASPGKVELTLN